MTIKSMQDLFIHELSDIYSAEKQLAKALPRLSRASENQELSKAFDKHTEETRGQIERIDKVVDLLDVRLKRIKCQGMEGLVDEAREIIETVPQGALRDAALIAGAQKAEHYEIASYGTLCSLARQLGHEDAAKLLGDTLQEEKATDQKLTELAEQGANQQAAQVSQGEQKHTPSSEARH
jgi:ferritin-like metal-binding protein YciE